MFNEITVSKDKLLDTLKTNLENHCKIVEEAKIGYIQKAIEVVSEKLNELKSNKLVDLHFNLPLPEDHSKEYKRAISMLEWSNSNVVKLSEQDFKSLVLDEWSWDKHFLTSNSIYSFIAASRCQSKGY